MSQWVELELRKEQFDMIIDCLESKACESDSFSEIREYLYLIDDLEKQEEKYNQKIYSECFIDL